MTAAVDPDDPAAVIPPPPGGPQSRRVPAGLSRLFHWAPAMSSVTYFATGLTGYYAAIQVEHLDSGGKVGVLALLTTMSGVAALIAQPLVGWASDRTRSRFGARRPWILVGALIGTVAMITAGLSGSVAVLAAGVCFVQFGYNLLQGPYSAILPDRVPERFRGRYSALTGIGVLLGSVLGPVLGGVFVHTIAVGYVSLAGILLLVVIVFLLRVPEPSNRDAPRTAAGSVAAALRSLWISPARYPDFYWGFLGRLLLFGGFDLASTYQLYIAQDYVGMTLSRAQTLVPLLNAAAVPGMIIGTVVAGPLSDRTGRRKPPVFAAGIIILVSSITPIASPTVPGLLLSTVIAGLGFGTFLAVDQALMSSLLPGRATFGKDLGVLNIAATLPNVIAPGVAGAVVSVFGSYRALYITEAIAVLIGALAILPIKKAR